MASKQSLQTTVMIAALLIALAHFTLVSVILFNVYIGAYFLVSGIIYAIGAFGAYLASGRLFKFANYGLILLAVIDDSLIVYTRTMPNIFFGRIVPWSTGWYPTGAVQVLIAQIVLIILSAFLLTKQN